MGVVCPIGNDPSSYWSSLAEGRGGVDKIREFPVSGVRTEAAGEVKDFDAKRSAPPRYRKALTKSLKYMARDIQLAVAAALAAVTDAGLIDSGVDPTRIGLDLGAGLISTELDELAPAINHAIAIGQGQFDFGDYGREGIPMIPPIWLLKYLPNMLACHISILVDCQGPSNSITEADAASCLAIGEAYRIIERGRADVMITGGADSKIHPLSYVRMCLMGLMSSWPGEPSQSCRPFDARRDGSVPGEGAGILVIEEREHALRRGARIHGELLGFGSGCDANPGGGLDPNGRGTAIALRSALRDAGLSPAEVGHVNAHGLGTVASDLAESRAIASVFGDAGTPVTALKGYLGSLVSGCGAVELIGSLLGANHGLVPAVLNCDEPDPSCAPIRLVREAPLAVENPIFAKCNVTRHGQAAALVVRGNPSGN